MLSIFLMDIAPCPSSGYNIFWGEYMNIKLKKLLSMVTSLGILLLSPVQAYANIEGTALVDQAEAPKPPEIVGKAGVLIDVASGAVLYDKNMHQQLPPASTTKILTGIIAIEKGNLEEMVTASKEAEMTEPSSIFLMEGEKVKLEDLVWALMLKSANDCAVAIAEHLGGSVEGFSKIMNSSARAFGAKNSNFINPNGLPDDEHVTTAYDLAMIARHAMQNEKFREIVGSKKKVIERQKPDGIKHLSNHNKLLNNYEGATGIKTGYTVKAQQCLVASAQRGNREFIAVVLGSQGNNIWTDASTLLDYGFEHFDSTVLMQNGESINPVQVKGGTSDLKLVASRGFAISYLKGQHVTPEKEVTLKTDLAAPIQAGKVVGKVTFKVGDESIGAIDLVAAETVKKQEIVQANTIQYWAGAFAVVLVALVGLRMWKVKQRREARRRIRRSWQEEW